MTILPFNGGYSVNGIEAVVTQRTGVLVLSVLDQFAEMQRPRIREVRLRVLRYLHVFLNKPQLVRKAEIGFRCATLSGCRDRDRVVSFSRINARSRENCTEQTSNAYDRVSCEFLLFRTRVARMLRGSRDIRRAHVR